MKTKEKLSLKGKSLFTFEPCPADTSSTLPTGWTLTRTTTGFSKQHHIEKEALSTGGKQV